LCLIEWVASFAAYVVWAIYKFKSYTVFIKTYTVVIVAGAAAAVVCMCAHSWVGVSTFGFK